MDRLHLTNSELDRVVAMSELPMESCHPTGFKGDDLVAAIEVMF